jgi:hypothetical protein
MDEITIVSGGLDGARATLQPTGGPHLFDDTATGSALPSPLNAGM